MNAAILCWWRYFYSRDRMMDPTQANQKQGSAVNQDVSPSPFLIT